MVEIVPILLLLSWSNYNKIGADKPSVLKAKSVAKFYHIKEDVIHKGHAINLAEIAIFRRQTAPCGLSTKWKNECGKNASCIVGEMTTSHKSSSRSLSRQRKEKKTDSRKDLVSLDWEIRRDICIEVPWIGKLWEVSYNSKHDVT